MRRKLTSLAETFALSTPFRISRGTKTAAEVVTVQIIAGEVAGLGECVPYPRYGETVASTIAAIAAVQDAIEDGASRQELQQLLPAGAARNAVDCALWDLESRLSGVPVAAGLGLPDPLPVVATAMTIGIDAPERMGAAAKMLTDVPLLKVKVDRSNPVAQLRAVRAVAPRPRMIVDPNESWTIDDVRSLQDLLVELKVDLLEQPLPAGDDMALAGFVSAVPIAADESVHVAADLAALPDGYDVVNIKLDKTGGLTAALDLADEARRRGFEVMTGCMICSSLSIAPALMIAANSAFADLDGPTWLARDRHGGAQCVDGMMRAPAAGFWGG